MSAGSPVHHPENALILHHGFRQEPLLIQRIDQANHQRASREFQVVLSGALEYGGNKASIQHGADVSGPCKSICPHVSQV